MAEAQRAAMVSANGSPSAHAALSGSYEELLRFRPSLDGGRFILRRSAEGRKRSGSFYTPAAVARTAVQAALEPLLEGRPEGGAPLQVLDPAMGTGVFLVEAAHLLASRWTDRSIREIAERCLRGVDQDPLAVELALLSLWLETGARPGLLERHLRRGDFLEGGDGTDGADAVVGNPPWGARCTRAQRELLMRRFPASTRGTFDSFKVFLDRASALARGTVGMVLPQAVLAQSSHADVRAMLLDRHDPYFVARLGDGAFPGAAAPACILVFGPRPGPDMVRCLDLRRGGTGSRRVPALLWRAEGGFPLEDRGRLALLERLQAAHPGLGELAHLYRIRDVGINYNRATVARRVLYTGQEPEDPQDRPRYRGRDFSRYSAVRPGGWLRHDASRLLEPGETLSLDPATYHLPEKIVFRQTADRIVATLDRSRMAMGRSVIAITRESDVSLRALLACLNSRLMTVLYRALAGEEGRLLPQVKVRTVASLPIPAVCALPVGDDPATPASLDGARGGDAEALPPRARRDPSSGWTCLDWLAGELLAQEGRNASLDALVDRAVYELYGLTPEEIALIEGG